MDEKEPSPEVQVPSREQVIAALRAIAERGYDNPDRLPWDDQEINAANAMFYAWQDDAARRAANSPDPAAVLENRVSGTMVFVDAGFKDPDYLDEIAHDSLETDLNYAQNQGLDALADRIRSYIAAIDARLAEQEEG